MPESKLTCQQQSLCPGGGDKDGRESAFLSASSGSVDGPDYLALTTPRLGDPVQGASACRERNNEELISPAGPFQCLGSSRTFSEGADVFPWEECCYTIGLSRGRIKNPGEVASAAAGSSDSHTPHGQTQTPGSLLPREGTNHRRGTPHRSQRKHGGNAPRPPQAGGLYPVSRGAPRCLCGRSNTHCADRQAEEHRAPGPARSRAEMTKPTAHLQGRSQNRRGHGRGWKGC